MSSSLFALANFLFSALFLVGAALLIVGFFLWLFGRSDIEEVLLEELGIEQKIGF